MKAIEMKQTLKEGDQTQTCLNDPLDGLKSDGKYEHLQIILSKTHDHQVGEDFLVVSPLGFGVYQLLDIDYQEGKIMMTLRNTDTNDIVEERLDINDSHPKLFLVCWADIKKLVHNDKASDLCKADLLEFDF